MTETREQKPIAWEALAQEINAHLHEKKWWEKSRSVFEVRALIHNEICEATKCILDRSNPPPFHQGKMSCGKWITPFSGRWTYTKKPEGEAVRLATAVMLCLGAIYIPHTPGFYDPVINGCTLVKTPIEFHGLFHSGLESFGRLSEDGLTMIGHVWGYFIKQGWDLEWTIRLVMRST